ncbi:MAG: nucleotidyltransferase domain-containing protein [Sphingobacteriales bacterium]|nr:nucleotidyltransferase domain-containing protein [Sphingobacteriales bacterium]
MKNKIIEKLRNVEKEYNIQILLACETGSRAWGFPSPDSDYDVRFIYKHHKDWYLSLSEKKDTIELMFDNNEMDLSGWDLRKTLNLLWKSNASLLERIQSPVVYIENQAFLEGIKNLATTCYSKIATMHHYLSMAKNMYGEVQQKEEVKLKKLFYALRTATACEWILEKETMPPIAFGIMLENLNFSTHFKEKINDLIALKATKSETYLHFQEKEINQYIEKIILKAENEAKSLPASKGQIEDLNSFFVKTLTP